MEAPDEEAREAIAARAYEIYLERQRDGAPGDDISDWCRAEDELRRPAADAATKQPTLDQKKRTARLALG